MVADPTLIKIAGVCLVCGERTLKAKLVRGPCPVFCTNPECENPDAVTNLLEADTDHLVRLGERSFDIQHPLRERWDGALFNCPLVKALTAMDGPPHPPGLYRAKPYELSPGAEAPGTLAWSLEPVEPEGGSDEGAHAD